MFPRTTPTPTIPTTASAAAGQQPRQQHRGWLLTTLLGGMFLGNVDIAVVNVAVPSIRANLHASGGALELIVSGYTLAYALLLVTSARLGDMRGYRRMFLLGLGAFTAASLACGLAPGAATLILARIIQGAAAAFMASQVLTGIQLHFDGPARGRALGLYAAALAGSAVIGQILGGALVSADLFGATWRPIFLLNVPLGLLLLLVAWRFLPADQQRRPQRLDAGGVATLSAALLLLVFPLVLGRDAGWPLWTWVSMGMSIPALAAFVAVEHRVEGHGGYPLVNLHLLGRSTIAWALAAPAIASSTYFALLFVLALYLQHGLGWSPLASGLALVSWVAAFGIAGPVLGRIQRHGRSTRPAAPVGALVLATSFGAIGGSLLAGTANGALLVTLLGTGGLGFGATFSGMLAHLTSAVTSRDAPDVSGLFNTILRVGGVLGVAIFGTIYLSLAGHAGRQAATHGFAIVTLTLAATALAAAAAAHLAIRSRGR
jgi:MFS family permease